VKAQLDNLKSVAERTFQSVRNIALLLRPSMLDDLGLAAALEWQGREVSRRSEIEVSVESESVPEDLPDDYKTCIYRLVQEALNNAVRHSGARNAKVVVEQLAKSIVVRVTDDGRGFDPVRSRGMGILGMEERVKRLGGTLRVESQPGKGATVDGGPSHSRPGVTREEDQRPACRRPHPDSRGSAHGGGCPTRPHGCRRSQ
jgi:signal transduction histidine kinase